MKHLRIATVALLALLTSCAFEVQQPANDSLVGRYQLVSTDGQGAVLLDTATGETWALGNDGEWRRCRGGPEN
jgi:hypothetical protein